MAACSEILEQECPIAELEAANVGLMVTSAWRSVAYDIQERQVVSKAFNASGKQDQILRSAHVASTVNLSQSHTLCPVR